MKIGLIHNEYGTHSGEEAMFYRIGRLLEQQGHTVHYFTKTSRDIDDTLSGKLSAFFSGIYSVQSRKQIRTFLDEVQPDIIQIQNLYPLISPSILLEIARYNIPVVMRCANYRLLCPNGLLLRNDKICHRCVGGREWWCLLKNCENNLPKSLGYALRHYVGRRFHWFRRYITKYYTQTQFQKTLLVQNGFDEEKIEVIPNMITYQDKPFVPGKYVGYLGRISKEKGIHTFLEAARQLKDFQFKMAGAVSLADFDPNNLPENVEYVGFVEKEQKEQFIRQASAMVVPSICYEGLPSSILEAMNNRTPVISSAIGGLTEVVQPDQTGLCFRPGDDVDLSDKIQQLLSCRQTQQRLTENASTWLKSNHTENIYYQRLITLYQEMQALKGKEAAILPAACPA